MNSLGLQFGKQRWLIVGLISWFFVAAVCMFAVPTVQAATMSDADIQAWCGGASLANEQEVTEYVQEPEGGYKLEQPISGVTEVKSAGEYLQLAYQLGLGLVGIIAVVIIMFGGLMWVQAAGNEQSISKAKELIVSAVVGLLIALLSYTILVFVNPEILRTELNIAVIPVNPQCPYPPPEVISFPSGPNIAGGGSACPSYVEAFSKVVQALSVVCPNCKIGIGSTYRTAEEQRPLRECYERAIEEGYYAADEKTPVAGKSCPSGCKGCNVAAKPCCSNHQRGFAADLWFEYNPPFSTTAGITTANIAATSRVKSDGKTTALSMTCNQGACETDPNLKQALANNQQVLKLIMESPIDGHPLFTKDKSEWWHFNLIDKSSCAVKEAANCQNKTIEPLGRNTVHAESYCRKGAEYAYAICEELPNNPPPCPTGFNNVNDGTCTDSGNLFAFDEDNRTNSDFLLPAKALYSTPPTCVPRP